MHGTVLVAVGKSLDHVACGKLYILSLHQEIGKAEALFSQAQGCDRFVELGQDDHSSTVA